MKEMKAVRKSQEPSFTFATGGGFGLHAVMGTRCTAMRHGISHVESVGSVGGAECIRTRTCRATSESNLFGSR